MIARRATALLLTLALAACGGGDETDSEAGATGAAQAASADAGVNADANPTANAAATVTPAEVEAFERGLTREIEAVRAAKARQSAGGTPEERFAAMRAGEEDSTAVEGAKAAGMDEARYRQVRQAMKQLLTALDFQGKIDGPMQLDTTRVPPEQRRIMTDDPYAPFAPATADAVRARLSTLAPVWAQYIRLTAVGG